MWNRISASARYAKFMPSVFICLSGRAESNSGPRQSVNHPSQIINIFFFFFHEKLALLHALRVKCDHLSDQSIHTPVTSVFSEEQDFSLLHSNAQGRYNRTCILEETLWSGLCYYELSICKDTKKDWNRSSVSCGSRCSVVSQAGAVLFFWGGGFWVFFVPFEMEWTLCSHKFTGDTLFTQNDFNRYFCKF